MSLQKMQLFDAATHPAAVVWRMSMGDLHRLNHDEMAYMRDTHRVWVDESLHQRVQFTPRMVDFSRDFGELRLPFPHMWFEWRNVRDGSDTLPMAVECCELPDSWVQRNEFSYLMVPWIEFRGIPHVYDQMLRVDFDDKGKLLGVSGYERKGEEIRVIPQNAMNRPRGHIDPGTTAGLVDLCWNGLLALGFMNCKNVKTERHERLQQLGKKQRRKRPAKLDYHTIVLPGGADIGGGQASGEPRELAQHKVRGHFKTFTAERPLMGQHVGTYWWGWQVRGSKDNGTVVSDYKVVAR
jgi:hypothetical protein